MTGSGKESELTGLREAVPGYFPPDRAQRSAMLREGMVCLDTNVLFALYRFTAGARDELLMAARVRDRGWRRGRG